MIEREAKKATQEEAIKGKIAMTVTANHHLNQPLMVLQGNLDMLRSKLEKIKTCTYSENINN